MEPCYAGSLALTRWGGGGGHKQPAGRPVFTQADQILYQVPGEKASYLQGICSWLSSKPNWSQGLRFPPIDPNGHSFWELARLVLVPVLRSHNPGKGSGGGARLNSSDLWYMSYTLNMGNKVAYPSDFR